jgi:hypothetical protein
VEEKAGEGRDDLESGANGFHVLIEQLLHSFHVEALVLVVFGVAGQRLVLVGILFAAVVVNVVIVIGILLGTGRHFRIFLLLSTPAFFKFFTTIRTSL